MTRVSIIGDRFMAPEVFEAALPKAGLDCRLHQLAWPDEPFVNACETGELAGLKEFMGEPGQIASMIGDAEVLVTHLAPVSASILERCPNLRLIAVSRGGPVNIDRAACAARDHSFSKHSKGDSCANIATDFSCERFHSEGLRFGLSFQIAQQNGRDVEVGGHTTSTATTERCLPFWVRRD